MSVINDFMKLYDKQYDFFESFSRIIASRTEEQLLRKGIKAVVTYRPKNAASLKEKIDKNNRRRKYVSVSEIFRDIKDLSGARLSLYFPLPEYIIDEIMNDAFVVLEKHYGLPLKHHDDYKRKHPGYHALHYHVKLKEKQALNRYLNAVAEIQVASTMMHAWAEIDHDLVYKPSFGNASINELAMLDEVNGLALSAEDSLKKLQHAMAQRTIRNGSAGDKYELANLLLINIEKEQFKKSRLGDVYLLQYYLETLEKNAFSQVLNFLDMINPGATGSITDQLLYMLLAKNYHPQKNNLRGYFKKLDFSNEEISLADEFISLWMVIEGRMANIMGDKSRKQRQYTAPAFKLLSQRKILTPAETAILENMYAVKKDVLHGMETTLPGYLSNCIVAVKALSAKIPAANTKTRKAVVTRK